MKKQNKIGVVITSQYYVHSPSSEYTSDFLMTLISEEKWIEQVNSRNS